MFLPLPLVAPLEEPFFPPFFPCARFSILEEYPFLFLHCRAPSPTDLHLCNFLEPGILPSPNSVDTCPTPILHLVEICRASPALELRNVERPLALLLLVPDVY